MLHLSPTLGRKHKAGEKARLLSARAFLTSRKMTISLKHFFFWSSEPLGSFPEVLKAYVICHEGPRGGGSPPPAHTSIPLATAPERDQATSPSGLSPKQTPAPGASSHGTYHAAC